MRRNHICFRYNNIAVEKLLGFSGSNSKQVRPNRDVEIYYGGWTLKQLRESKAGQLHMEQDQSWYDAFEWKAEPGYYRVKFRVPRSNHKDWRKQCSHLRKQYPKWQSASVVVVATALLVHLIETGEDLLNSNAGHGDWSRCAETFPDGSHVTITVSGALVDVPENHFKGGSYDYWLAAAQKC